MNCEEVTALLSAAADGELDPLRSHALRGHLAGCEACAARSAAGLQWQQHLRGELPYYTAPAALRERMQVQAQAQAQAQAQFAAAAAVPGTRVREPGPPPRWRWFGAGVLAGTALVALVALAGVSLVAPTSRSSIETMAAQIVARHTAATLGGRSVQVASSDHHKVKPWLSARLDYTIPVDDWARAGFPLAGARIDEIDGQRVATLVYGHRDHLIDVFVRPAAGGTGAALRRTHRGFNVAQARDAEMEWIAVSDLNPPALAVFVEGLAKGVVKPTAE